MNHTLTIKASIKENILNLLKKVRFGLNITQISENLSISRNTTKKYLNELKKEKYVNYKEVGLAKIWYPSTIKRKNNDMPFIEMIKFYKAFDKASFRNLSNPELFAKDLGKEMGNLLEWKSQKLVDKQENKIYTINEILNYIFQVYNLIKTFYGSVFGIILEKNDKSLSINKSFAIIKVIPTLIKAEGPTLLYYLVAGVIESLIRRELREDILVDVYELQQESKYGFIKIDIKMN